MTILEKTMRTRSREIEALRLRLIHELYEHHGIPKEERKNYEQLEADMCICALAPAVAAILVSTHQADAAAGQFMDLLAYHVQRFKEQAFAHRPMFGPVQ
jgi:hypothetical protein